MTWRRCVDELPEDQASILVYMPNAVEQIWIGYYNAPAHAWTAEYGGPIAELITHWMPLPEPPCPE